MNVLWVTSVFPWSGNPTLGTFYQTQAQALSRLGAKVSIVVTAVWIPTIVALLSPRHAQQRQAPRRQTVGDLEVTRIAYFGHRLHRYGGRPHLTMAKKVLQALPFQPDLVHGHSAYPVGLAAVEVARALGVPSVVTLHGSDVNVAAVRSRLGAERFHAAVAGADRVLSVSQALQRKAHVLTGCPVDYLPIGIDLRHFSATMPRDQARAALGLPQDRPVILYVGNLLDSKGVAVALEALGLPGLAHVLGVFVGLGPLGPVVASRPNCIWVQGVANTAIATYMAAADSLILPSYSEGLPTVLVEAGATGTPVIATRVGGIPELLEEDRGLMVEPGSVQELQSAIHAILDQPEAARARADRCRAHIMGAFDVDRNAGELLRVYQDLIAQKSSPTA